MNSRWSIRGNLLLVNMIVIGLILWLTISFLYVAIAQRNQALQLFNNIRTDKVVLSTSTALTSERLSLQLSLASSEVVSRDKLAKFQLQGDDISALFQEMVKTIGIETIAPGFFNNSATTKSNTRDRLNELDILNRQLQEHRRLAHAQLLLPLQLRNPEVMANVFDAQTAMINSLAHLFRGLKYLPDSEASLVSKLHSILNEVIVVSSNISQKNAMLGELLVSVEPPGSRILSQIDILDNAIIRQLDDVVMVSESCVERKELHSLAVELRNYYENVRSETELDIKNNWRLPDHGGLSIVDWTAVNNQMTGRLANLTRSTHGALDEVASVNKTRATRNVIIDVFLVGLCLLIAGASAALSGRIKKLAFNDSLTGLPNRINFESALHANSGSTSQDSAHQAVIFIDLDRFKSINDTYGHGIGDKLLKEIARRLLEICCSGEMVARLGGDEFGVYLSDVDSEEQVETLASNIVKSIVRDIQIDELHLKVGASAGISISPDDCGSGAELLRNADIAMYHSKYNQAISVYRFNQTIAGNYHNRLKLELDLKRGIESDELCVFYQPKVCTRTGRVKGVEALLRWQHPERGFISPAEFIPIAEETGLMGTIGRWVMNEACRELAEIEHNHNLGIHVAVNISAQQFNDERFSESVHEALSTNNLANDKLELEVTESLVMYDVSRVVTMLKGLQSSGIKIAIDDFGTGYSSLQYLQELPLNTLKIDRAFVLALDENDPHCSVANSIVQLARLFNLDTVAEGVETDDQDTKIRALGVSQIQGYLYSKPIPGDSLPRVVQEINARSGESDSSSSRAA